MRMSVQAFYDLKREEKKEKRSYREKGFIRKPDDGIAPTSKKYLSACIEVVAHYETTTVTATATIGCLSYMQLEQKCL